jgi:flagellar biosynthetic protein FliR
MFPLTLGAEQLALFTLYFARLTAFMFAAPVFSGRYVPPLYKISFSFFLALIFFAANGAKADPALLETSRYVTSFMTEIAIGLVLGFFVSFILLAFQMAGEQIGYQMGFAIVNVFDFSTEEQISLVSEFLFTVAILVFLNLNLHHGLLMTWNDSLRPGTVDMSAFTIASVTTICRDFFVIAFQLAAPLIAFLLLADIALGVVARVMPQMNVFFVAIPVKIAMGLFMLSAAVMAYGVAMQKAGNTVFRDVFRIISG